MKEDANDSRLLPGGDPGWLDAVRRQVETLRYGVVQIVVHNSQVVQIEKTERFRLGNDFTRLR